MAACNEARISPDVPLEVVGPPPYGRGEARLKVFPVRREVVPDMRGNGQVLDEVHNLAERLEGLREILVALGRRALRQRIEVGSPGDIPIHIILRREAGLLLGRRRVLGAPDRAGPDRTEPCATQAIPIGSGRSVTPAVGYSLKGLWKWLLARQGGASSRVEPVRSQSRALLARPEAG